MVTRAPRPARNTASCLDPTVATSRAVWRDFLAAPEPILLMVDLPAAYSGADCADVPKPSAQLMPSDMREPRYFEGLDRRRSPQPQHSFRGSPCG